MSIRTEARVTNPDKVDATISVTMSLREWAQIKTLLKQPDSEYWDPNNVLAREIDDVLSKLNKDVIQFVHDEDTP